MQTAELISQLRMQAREISDANEPGWGNTMTAAADTLQRYVDAIDAIYNHNEAARAAVTLHFGTLHQTAPNAKVSGAGTASAGLLGSESAGPEKGD